MCLALSRRLPPIPLVLCSPSNAGSREASNPPVKWSYRKLVLWWALAFLSIGWIVFYINAVTKNSAAVFSPPLTLFALLSAATFLLLLVLFWRHQITHTIRSPTSVGIPTGN